MMGSNLSYFSGGIVGGPSVEEKVSKKVFSVDKNIRGLLETILVNSGIFSLSIDELSTENVPVRNSVEFEKEDPIYSRGRNLSANHSKMVREEPEKMIGSGIIMQFTFSWSLNVVIATKKDGNPCFSVYHSTLNQRMKAYRYIIPKI